ncbi:MULTISPECIES: S8 family peptidase [Blautia]|uniref:S8 family peptidase n=1 Tax=Blautia TaxID=572511 RepID=UPI00164E3880|nr:MULTISPECIES: S8 family peptidase [Blautia]
MNKIVDENYMDLIFDNYLLKTYSTDNSITQLNDRYSISHVPVDKMDYCDLGKKNLYYSYPGLFTLMSEVSLEEAGVTVIQNNPHLALYGNNILIGIIDTGIDYQHPAFMTSNDTSRIVRIWDQSIQDGPAPKGYSYGTEYTNEIINTALNSSDPLSVVPSRDENGHGTAIASIAAGSSDGISTFRGVVPKAQLVVVKLKKPKKKLLQISFVPDNVECYQETDIILGLKYLQETAERLKRPMAVCFTLGSSQGSHTGLGTLSEYISGLSLLPRFNIAIAAGNEGSRNRHYYSSVDKAPYEHMFELKVSEKDKLFAVEIWAQVPARLTIEIITPVGESTRLNYPQLGSCNQFSFVFEDSQLWVNNIVLEKETGDQLIVVRFKNPNSGIWRFRLVNLETEAFSFDAWLPSGDLISKDTYFLGASPYTTVTIPGNSENALTVTAYDPLTDRILTNAGRGYTRINQITPDVAAPGYQTSCAFPDKRYGAMTGTGAAAAFTAGVIAMVLEWAVREGNYPAITGYEINRLIIRGANRNISTNKYPNPIWGYGILDIYNLFLKLSL